MFRGILIGIAFLVCVSARSEIGAVWLSLGNTSDDVVVNFVSDKPSAVVDIERAGENRKSVRLDSPSDGVFRFPINRAGKGGFSYRISDADDTTKFYKVPRAGENGTFRAVFLGNMGYCKIGDFSFVAKENPDAIFTCGDNVPNLHYDKGGIASDGGFAEYVKMINRFPRDLIASTPFVPALGNHDKEIRPRGNRKYPPIPTYDTEASTFKKFFGADGVRIVRVPRFSLAFSLLDICHVQDYGTTWQACRDFSENSAQFKSFADFADNRRDSFVFAVMNERVDFRNRQGRHWRKYFEKTDAVISGFGYFLERAEDGVPYFNVSLASGDKYPDNKSKFFAANTGYLLLTASETGIVSMELKTVSGKTLDTISLTKNTKKE